MPEPIRILSLDGGGLSVQSQLLILKRLMETVDPVSPPKPCDYFDLIGGAIHGGIVAVMLGCLKMSVPECISAYAAFESKALISKPASSMFLTPSQREANSSTLQKAIKEMLEENGCGSDAPLRDPSDTGCKTFVTASIMDLENDCRSNDVGLTSYDQKDVETSPSLASIKLWEACFATLFSTRLFDGSPSGFLENTELSTNYQTNPIQRAWKHAQDVWGDEERLSNFASVVSVGMGDLDRTAGQEYDEELGSGLANAQREAFLMLYHNPQFEDKVKSMYFRFNTPDVDLCDLKGDTVEERVLAATVTYLESHQLIRRMKACVNGVKLPSLWKCENKPQHETAQPLNNLHYQPNKSNPVFEGSSWLDAPNPGSYLSFGSEGVTATVNSYGDLMQFSAYLGAGTSGMFCADHTYVLEPYCVQDRMHCLMDLKDGKVDPGLTYGLIIPEFASINCADVSYVHDRWPRFHFPSETMDMNMQWIVNDRTIVQSCVFKNNTGDTQTQSCHFKNGIHIRDLEYVDNKNSFNDVWLGHMHRNGPGSYGWILVNPLGPKKEALKKGDHVEYDTDDTDSISMVSRSSSSGKSANGTTNATNENGENGTSTKERPSSPAPGDQISFEDTKDEPWAVAVLVSIFINGQQQPWGDVPHPLSEDGKIEFNVMLEGNSTAEVTVAYKIVLLPTDLIHGPKGNSQDFLISPLAANVSEFLLEEASQFQPFYASELMGQSSDSPQFSISGFPATAAASSKHMDFIIRRNLEYILSVCSIPLHIPEFEENRILPVALTCGEISGHRVHTRASFFALNFLVQVSSLISKAGVDKFKALQTRIKLVCMGHVRWLSQLEKTRSKQISANYWPTGKLMTLPHGSRSFIPNDSWTDAAYQLLKVTEVAKIYPSQEDQKLAREFISDVGHGWARSLSRADFHRSFTWPHSTVEGYKKYRLSDQIWIWKATKEVLLHLADGDAPDKEKKLIHFYPPGDLQKTIHQRFITEDSVSGKSMLATTRSLRETRFLLHASDTALFYALEWDFFLKSSSVHEAWENTLSAQPRYWENSEAKWGKSTRYSLAIVLGARDLTLNKRSPVDLLDSSLHLLMRTTSSSGLFHRQLDVTTKEPGDFLGESERDLHFSATFEIPYILLKDLSKICPVSPAAADERPSEPVPSHDETTVSLPKRQTLSLESDDTSTGTVQKTPKRDDDLGPILETTAATNTQPETLIAKKRASHNFLVGQNNIVELEDEWLYNVPSFFTVFSARLTTAKGFKGEVWRLLEQAEGETVGSGIVKVAREIVAATDQDSLLPPASDFEDILVWSVDVPKQKSGKKDWHLRSRQNYNVSARSFQYNSPLLFNLNVGRYIYTAKKRFIWLAKATRTTALVCVASSPEDERQPMMQFFNRHSQYHDAFLDRINMALNLWETELHLSFYRLVSQDHKPGLDPCIPTPNASVLPRGAKLRLAQASMGFRFVGDVFDRYWTCHFVEYLPDSTKHLDIHPWDQGNDIVQQQGCWRQRKVLELHLFDRILKELVGNSNHIFKEIQMELGVKHGAFAFSITNSDVYFSSSTRWQEFQQILQVVEEELYGVLAIIAQWETRERDRGAQQPRWTRNDERKYRNAITRLERMNRGRIGELQKCHASIRSLRETLVRRQEQIRDDLGLRGAENIRFFTYVTVVFLPLGFAASIFSMNGTPPANLIRDMAIFAVIALLITTLALINAKRVNAVMSWLKGLLEAQSIEKINESPLFDSYETRKSKREDRARRAKSFELTYRWERQVASNGPRNKRGNLDDPSSESVEDTPLFKYRHAKVPFHLDFWLGYLFLEFPARGVLMGFDALTKPNFANWKTYTSVIVGIFLLPVFAISYVFQTIFYNTVDLMHVFLKHLKQKNEKPEITPLDEALFKDRLNWLMFPHRPLLQPENQELKAMIEKTKC